MGVNGHPLGLPLALDPREPSVPLPGKWTFWAETMVPPYRPLGNVDVSSFYCVRRLNAFGHGNVTVNLPCGLDSDTMLNLWGWRLWAMYAGEPYWCGVPTGLADQNGSEHVQFTLIELPGYLTRRQQDQHPFRQFLGDEQTYIAEQLAAPVRDVGVVILTDAGGGFRRDRKYEYLEGGSLGQLLINLCGVLYGPEFRTEYRTAANGRPQCVLRIAYPRVGSDQAGLGVSVPGAILNYRYQMDSDQLRTHTFAVGDLPADAGENDTRPVVQYVVSNPSLPRLDAVDDWPGTILLPTLRERAITAASINSIGAQAVQGSPPESYPPLTSYGPGDTVTVRAVTPLIPDGIEFPARLEQVEVNAATGVATWSAAFTQPPQGTRLSLNGGLIRLATASSQLFHSGGLTPRLGGPRDNADGQTGLGPGRQLRRLRRPRRDHRCDGRAGGPGAAGGGLGRGRAGRDHPRRLGRCGQLRGLHQRRGRHPRRAGGAGQPRPRHRQPRGRGVVRHEPRGRHLPAVGADQGRRRGPHRHPAGVDHGPR
jgi:hypothetical protein